MTFSTISKSGMTNNQRVTPDPDKAKPLFPRLCMEYSKQIFDNLITSKDIKSCILRGNRVYDKARRLVEQHINQRMIETRITHRSNSSFIVDDDEEEEATGYHRARTQGLDLSTGESDNSI